MGINDLSLEELIDHIGDLKASIKHLDKVMRERQSEAIAQMIAAGTDTTKGATFTGKLVHAERATLDEEALLETLTDHQVRKVTRRRLDHNLLEAEVSAGRISIQLVADATETSVNAPYIKLTGIPTRKLVNTDQSKTT